MRKVLSTILPQPNNMGDADSLLPNGKGVWIPIDHGVSDYPVEGLEDLDDLIAKISHADAIVAQKGVVSRYSMDANMVSHLSVSTRHAGSRSSDKILVGSVEESLSRGAKGVSVQVNMGSPDEPEMIERLGLVTQDAHFLTCPVLGMIYPRGENLDVMEDDDTQGAAHAARLAFELGCDVVKTKWTGSIESFRKVTDSVPIPVLIAGGPAGSTTEETLTTVHQAMQAGGGGVCMGRQVFSHATPGKMVTALRAIIHDGTSVEKAMQDAGL
jgi:DhnA family fructose-bisphosphate aldolase class Ia